MIRNGFKIRKATGVFATLIMNQPVPLVVTDDNYVIGKLSSINNNYLLNGIYQLSYGDYVRVKVPFGNGYTKTLDPEELMQFPENYEFRMPPARRGRNRS